MIAIRHPFAPDDRGALIGPSEAFDPEADPLPSIYQIQNHLAIEIVAHLARDGVPFIFQGGTALQLKLGSQTRFSIDVDLQSQEHALVHDGLRRFVARFPHSDIRLVEPPRELKVDGVRHTIEFHRTTDEASRTPLRILVEVVPTGGDLEGMEPTVLRSLGHEWGMAVDAPTLERFAAQKFCVIGPKTVGKPIGPNQTHARQNQGVCKQIHDIGRLLRLDLDPAKVMRSYADEVRQANERRGRSFAPQDVARDAAALLAGIRDPPLNDPSGALANYALWSGYEDSRRWIRDRGSWGKQDYRIHGGVLHAMARQLATDHLDLSEIRRPLVEQEVPRDILERIDADLTGRAVWVASDGFAGDARVAWAWWPGTGLAE